MRYSALGLTMGVLESLFANQAICSEFPFIGYAKNSWNGASGVPYGGGCGGCGANRPNRDYRQHLLETVKAGVVSLPPERVMRLKDLLGTDKIVLHFVVRGQSITKEL